MGQSDSLLVLRLSLASHDTHSWVREGKLIKSKGLLERGKWILVRVGGGLWGVRQPMGPITRVKDMPLNLTSLRNSQSLTG